MPSYSSSTSTSTESNNNPVYDYLKSRLDLPIHSIMNSTSTINTLTYLFNHMKCGILVMIRDNKLVLFCPFVNKDYTNNWGDFPFIGTYLSYLTHTCVYQIVYTISVMYIYLLRYS